MVNQEATTIVVAKKGWQSMKEGWMNARKLRSRVNQTGWWAGYDGREPRKSQAPFRTEHLSGSWYHLSKWRVLHGEFMGKLVRIGSQRCVQAF